MKIKEIMTKDIVTVNLDTKITDVAKMLHEKNIHGVPVVEGGKLVGIITETDFFTKNESEIYLPSYIEFLKNVNVAESGNDEKKQQFEQLLDAKAEDIMTGQCITLHPDSDVSAMFQLVKEAKLHTVPVVLEDDNLVGVVTVADIIKLI